MSNYPLLDRRRCIVGPVPSRPPASMPPNRSRRGHRLQVKLLMFDLTLALAAVNRCNLPPALA